MAHKERIDQNKPPRIGGRPRGRRGIGRSKSSVRPKGTQGKSSGKGKGKERAGGVDSKNIKEDLVLK